MLYQYTTVEALRAILINKTMRFTNLSRVNDLEEAQTNDIKNFGKTLYVSCWTKMQEENFLMWKSYAGDCHGVRIGLSELPFKKYHYSENQLFLSGEFESYIDYNKVIQQYGKTVLPFKDIEMVDITYTNDDSKVIPNVKTVTGGGAHMSFGRFGPNNEWGIMTRSEPKKVSYSYQELGKYKKKAFINESETRYIIKMLPYDLVVSGLTDSKQLEETLKIIESGQYELPNYYDIDLDINAFKEMEIMIGPQADEMTIVEIVNQLNPTARMTKSKLKVQ